MTAHNSAAETVPTSPAPEAAVRSGRRRALRWLVPVGAVGVVAVLASGVLSANAKPNLADQTAAQLLASIGNAKLAGFSGTVVQKASLGLPELPNMGGGNGGGAAASNPLSLLSGSHTARVWYGGETKQRVAILNSLGEQDVFRNGRDLWQWDSESKEVSHSTLPADAAHGSPPASAGLTPDEAAKQALAMIDPSTKVSTDHTATVAGRSTYTLVLAPRDTRSRVGQVRISVDGEHKLPLGVQVYARGSDKAALDIAFTRIDFSVPSDSFFTFSPPPNAVTKAPGSSDSFPGGGSRAPGAPGMGQSGSGKVTTIGTGWTTVAKVTGVPSLAELGKQDSSVASLLGSLPTVQGSWGSGRLFSSALVTALFTSDGRVYVGAVDPDLLYQAAARK